MKTLKKLGPLDSASETLDLHFRRISEFPLLTHAGEVSLAKQLERTDLSITRVLLSTAAGRESLREIAKALRARELRQEEVERNPKPDNDLAARIDCVVVLAHRRAASARGKKMRCHPRALGLRLHPRTVAKLAEHCPRVAELRRRADAITADFVHANLRIVVTFARRYRGMALVDLVQEGNFGLLRAIDKFDHRRGLRFSTYAAWWIRHALTRALADQSRMIRLPVHLTGAVQRVRRAQDRLVRETGVEPSAEELATRTGLPLQNVKRALDVVAQPVSLDVPVGDDRDMDLGDLVADVSHVSAEEVVAETELRDGARELLATLSEREAEVLRLRFGVGGRALGTLEEIGARLSVSRERARQLERDALRKLRAHSQAQRLRANLG